MKDAFRHNTASVACGSRAAACNGLIVHSKVHTCAQDLTIVLTASSIFGAFFEAIKQPVLNGYILAGSLVGPDGLALVKELVQVESLAQVRLLPCWPAC